MDDRSSFFLRLPVAQQLDTVAWAARERLSDRSFRQLRSAKQSVNHWRVDSDETSSLTAFQVGERRVEEGNAHAQVDSPGIESRILFGGA
jgi:hypothetical protein